MNSLFDRHANNETFLRILGCSKQACYTHRAYLKRAAHNISRGYNHVSNNKVHTNARPDPDVLEAAKTRLQAPRTITAWLLGDPDPGYHAARAEIERVAKIVKEELHRKAKLARREPVD